MLGHLEGRLDKVTAVIRQVAVQGKALELAMPEESADCISSRESSEELEAPALQSSTGEHRIVDIEPTPGALQDQEDPKKKGTHPPVALRKAIEGRRKLNGRR